MTATAKALGLSTSKLAVEMSEAQCQTLAASMTSRQLLSGEVLVREGDTDDHLYVVVSGSLGIIKAAWHRRGGDAERDCARATSWANSPSSTARRATPRSWRMNDTRCWA